MRLLASFASALALSSLSVTVHAQETAPAVDVTTRQAESVQDAQRARAMAAASCAQQVADFAVTCTAEQQENLVHLHRVSLAIDRRAAVGGRGRQALDNVDGARSSVRRQTERLLLAESIWVWQHDRESAVDYHVRTTASRHAITACRDYRQTGGQACTAEQFNGVTRLYAGAVSRGLGGWREGTDAQSLKAAAARLLSPETATP